MTEEKEQKNYSETIEYQEEINGAESSLDFKKKTERLKEKLENCRKEKDEFLLGWQRAKADFLNYKNDEKKRLEEWRRWLRRDYILAIIPILDDIEKSLLHLPQDLRDTEWAKGFSQIKERFASTIKGFGVKEIKSLGENFNPEFHEAIEETESDKEEGTVVEELEKGYTLDGIVVRPAKVKVSKKV